jgi:hypothetical protein
MPEALSWTAVLENVQAALRQALRDAEARAQALPDDPGPPPESPCRQALEAFPERLGRLQELVGRAERATAEADAAIAAVEEEVRRWRARAGGAGGA